MVTFGACIRVRFWFNPRARVNSWVRIMVVVSVRAKFRVMVQYSNRVRVRLHLLLGIWLGLWPGLWFRFMLGLGL